MAISGISDFCQAPGGCQEAVDKRQTGCSSKLWLAVSQGEEELWAPSTTGSIPPPPLQQPATSPPAERFHQATSSVHLGAVPCTTKDTTCTWSVHNSQGFSGDWTWCNAVYPQALPGPQICSQARGTGHPQHHHRGLGTRPRSTAKPTCPPPAIELPWLTGEPSYTGKVSPLPGARPGLGTGQKWLCPGATLLRMAKAWVRTKN